MVKDTTVTVSPVGYVQFNTDGTGSTTIETYVSSQPPTSAIIGPTAFTYKTAGSALTVKYATADTSLTETATVNGKELQVGFKLSGNIASVVYTSEITQYFTK